MRTLLVTLVIALSACVAKAQDAAQAAQQATQQAIQANQQAAQSAQIAMQNATPPPAGPSLAATPKFSLKQGVVSAPVTLRIQDKSRGAIIYYTIDGWTPTINSTRYKGPITIDSNTTIQAIAISPYFLRSRVATAQYTIKGSKTASSDSSVLPVAPISPALSADGKLVLPKGTLVPLVFASEVNSRTASFGDKISLTLADDIKVGTQIVLKKGSSASATVIQVDQTGAGGFPGEVDFEVNTLNANGATIKLLGSAAKEGQAKPPNAAFLIPVVGPFTLLKHGTDAEISPGAIFTASVAEDAVLTPVNH
jgi:Chitobiase/beta-hexosaminidase C-terminal domain